MKYDINISNAIEKLRKYAGLKLEVCGSWLWIDGDTQAHVFAIRAVGGKFAPRKGKWYVRPSYAKPVRKEEQHMSDIRQWFGSHTVK